MTVPRPLTKDELVRILASYGDRSPADVPDRVDSLEVAWVVHTVEERFGVELDLDDAQLTRMVTLDSVLDVLGSAVAAVAVAPDLPGPSAPSSPSALAVPGGERVGDTASGG
ncbi:acyl carrier protein [Streptomyces sp. NPDC003038]|uniref:acyl carrier protein n=1 Tax=unclassified Streptomyces TaxID=2593676 RepID=UPI0033B26323